MAAKKKASPSRIPPKKKAEPEREHISHDGIGNRATRFRGDWFALAKEYGGVEALAKMIGVSYSTLNRWAVRGDPVPKPSRMLLIMLAAARGLTFDPDKT